MSNAAATAAFRAARDLLLNHREDYAAAREAFDWPSLEEFNWALDWFDVIAAEHGDRTALRVVGDDGSDEAVSYAAMAARSNQVANWLRGLGVRRGDRVLLMLGNVVPLWEVMLAAIKLGAVIIPASTLLQPADLADRVSRGDVRHVVAEAAQVPKFADVPGGWTRVIVGGEAQRLAGTPTRARARRRRTSRPTGSRRRPTRCCSTSPRGPRRSPSSSGIRTSATRRATCPRCTGSASSPATCT